VKTFSGNNRHVLDGQLAGITVRRTLRRLGVKNFPGEVGKFSDVLTAEQNAAHIPSRPSASKKKRELQSSNDADIDQTGMEQIQDSLPALRVLSPVQPEAVTQSLTQPDNIALGAVGFSNIMLLAHPLAIVYITSCQQDHRMIYVSPQIANLGFIPEAWLGKPDFRLQQVYEEDSGLVGQAFKHSCATAEVFSCHYRLYDHAGKVHWFHDEASVVCDGSGTPLFIRGVMLDITDKKAMEAELTQHRYYLDWNVEKRTEQLVKRVTVLESCNTALCDKLALARKNLATLNQTPEHVLSGAA
jgi:PAS domain-containing protein